MISENKIREVGEIGDVNEISQKLGVSIESASRYLRLYKSYFAKEKKPERKIKMLFVDIETAPSIVATYRMWKTNIYPDGIIEDWHMISWSAKWLYEDNTMHDVITMEELRDGYDYRICLSLWELLDEADIVVAHNLYGFDEPKINTRFIVNGLNPPSPYRKIDTLSALRSRAGFSHNALDAVNEVLGLGAKSEEKGFMFKEWRNAKILGDDTALDRIETYNMNDSIILEELYLRLRPWIPRHPNVAVFYDDSTPVCHKCGSTHLVNSGDKYYTSIGAYETYKCEECGSYSKARKSSYTSALSGVGL